MEEITRILSERFGWELDTSRWEVKPLTAEEIDLAVTEGVMKTVNFPTFPTGGFASGGYLKAAREMFRPGEVVAQLDPPRPYAMTKTSRKHLLSTLKSALRNPELRGALFAKLREEGDRETLTTLYRLTNTALFKMQWDEATARKPGDDKAGEHY